MMFASVNLLYGRRATLAKFVVLEHLARIPYQSWERVAQRAIARTEGDRTSPSGSWTASSRPGPSRTTSSAAC